MTVFRKKKLKTQRHKQTIHYKYLWVTPRYTLEYCFVLAGYQYLVHTYTGDTRGAGTDANVVITIFGDEGDSGEKKLDNARNNFERGK